MKIHRKNTTCSIRSPITKTYLYNFDPLLYSKTGVYRGMYYFFLFLLKNIDCGYSLEPPRRGGSNEYPQSMFWADMWKKQTEVFVQKYRQGRLWSDCADAHADLSFCCNQMLEGSFSHVAAQFFIVSHQPLFSILFTSMIIICVLSDGEI